MTFQINHDPHFSLTPKTRNLLNKRSVWTVSVVDVRTSIIHSRKKKELAVAANAWIDIESAIYFISRRELFSSHW